MFPADFEFSFAFARSPILTDRFAYSSSHIVCCRLLLVIPYSQIVFMCFLILTFSFFCNPMVSLLSLPTMSLLSLLSLLSPYGVSPVTPVTLRCLSTVSPYGVSPVSPVSLRCRSCHPRLSCLPTVSLLSVLSPYGVATVSPVSIRCHTWVGFYI